MLLDRYRQYVFQVAYSVLGDAQHAEDAAQEAFVKIYYSLPCWNAQGFKTWITRIAVNKAIDWKRKLARRQEELNDDAAAFDALQQRAESQVEAAVLGRETRERIRQRIGELPVSYQEIVRAYYLEEKNYQEIAAEQGVAVKTVASQLYRARQWMRSRWKEEDFR